MKKLLIVVPAMHLGGQERVAVNTVRILKPDLDIKIAIFDPADAVYTPECEVINLNIPATVPGKLRQGFHLIRRVLALRRLKQKLQVDYTYSLGRPANLANVLSRSRGKILVGQRNYLGAGKDFFNALIFRRADRIVCVSREVRNRIGENYPAFREKLRFLYNPLDRAGILRQGAEEVDDYSFGDYTIVTHGRLHPVKHYPRLIKAFSLIVQKIPEARLLILGEGEQRGELEGLVQSLGLTERVTLPGFRANPYAYLRRSQVYVLSSWSEGLPNSLMEGMCFLPVVSVDCKSGPRELLSDGPSERVCTGIEEADYGILVRPAADAAWSEEITEDDRLLAEAVLTLLEDPEKRERYRERAFARAGMFDEEAYRRNLLQLLEGS